MLTSEEQREEYIRLYDMYGKQVADSIRVGCDSLVHCSISCKMVMDDVDCIARNNATANDHGIK